MGAVVQVTRARVGRRGLLHIREVVGHHVREVDDIRAERLELGLRRLPLFDSGLSLEKFFIFNFFFR